MEDLSKTPKRGSTPEAVRAIVFKADMQKLIADSAALSVNAELMDEIDRVAAKALQTVKRVMLMNANREGKSKWLSLPPHEHMEHARIHAMNGEIENCLTRCAMALVIEDMLQNDPSSIKI